MAEGKGKKLDSKEENGNKGKIMYISSITGGALGRVTLLKSQ